MNLRCLGCNHTTATVELREKLAFDAAALPAALREFTLGTQSEAVILSTCNRTEIYFSGPDSDFESALAHLAKHRQMDVSTLQPILYQLSDRAAVRHLFRVAASLDSLALGEGQIAGQVKAAFELAQTQDTAGPLLHALFPHALKAAKRVRSETGISAGHVSISSVAVDFVKQVFDRFEDKTILVIGAGKMARLTLKHLKELNPKQILVTNRSPEKAAEVADLCSGRVVAWEQLDGALAEADIALSTTGAAEPIMPRERFRKHVQPHRGGGTLVVLDIAVPRDFDAAIHDGDRVCVFNIDDLQQVRNSTLAERRKAVDPAEAIIDAEVKRFAEDWERRRSGPVIRQLHAEVDKLRDAIATPLLAKLNGKLTDAEREQIAGAFRLFQNRLLHGPIAALQDAAKEGESHTLMTSLKKLFRLE
jgi:glutamyl-tRNA reductase